MIDLHCHILPGIDDGAPDLETSLAMARMAVTDGIIATACTPHILPGVYDNKGNDIRARVTGLSAALENAQIPLMLVAGADAHLDPALLQGLKDERVPTLGSSRYFLLEPPHQVAPPRFADYCFALIAAGYVPVLTHPERLAWIENNYQLISKLQAAGILMQLTSASITGQFGKRPQYWAERMLDEKIVDLLASDGHNTTERPPQMSKARDVVAKRCGDATAVRLVVSTPLAILEDVISSKLRQPRELEDRRSL